MTNAYKELYTNDMTLFYSLIVYYIVSRDIVCFSSFGSVCLHFHELIEDDSSGGG